MPLTLDELKLMQNVLKELDLFPDQVNAFNECLRIINREIKLKETDFIRMVDAQGNSIDNDGN